MQEFFDIAIASGSKALYATAVYRSQALRPPGGKARVRPLGTNIFLPVCAVSRHASAIQWSKDSFAAHSSSCKSAGVVRQDLLSETIEK